MELTRSGAATCSDPHALHEHEGPAPRGTLVLGAETDRSARWLVARLRASGDPCELAERMPDPAPSSSLVIDRLTERGVDPLLEAFAAAHVGFSCAEPDVDDTSPCPLLEAALRAGGAEGRFVHLVVVDGRIIGLRRMQTLLGEPVPERVQLATARFASAMGAECGFLGLDLVVDAVGRWWFGGSTTLPMLEVAGDELIALLRDRARAVG
ncbi:hypothetical protein [Protaetiibacter mangrovi]|uniref:Uncharacterized protein n=1 Tax=Protaetiibacter mangrovi TaxID=2970926 RepID=A0ABT1ZG72_9MICO|nr:hypothetical protein [Protaetiibacter mangrovi]MCS0499719.1 hypothetical protein [Protaetiibacter mangrovi]TPX04414.1 hypothetical protein FJ656_12015 [Schumannella luteola]